MDVLALLSAITACVMAQATVMAYLAFVLAPVEVFFRSLGFQQADYDNLLLRLVAPPLLFGTAVSGPPIVLTLIVSWVWTRYQLVIAPRPPLSAIRAAADPGDRQSDVNFAMNRCAGGSSIWRRSGVCREPC